MLSDLQLQRPAVVIFGFPVLVRGVVIGKLHPGRILLETFAGTDSDVPQQHGLGERSGPIERTPCRLAAPAGGEPFGPGIASPRQGPRYVRELLRARGPSTVDPSILPASPMYNAPPSLGHD